jgi:guanyl-specific ribonuclease Sa
VAIAAAAVANRTSTATSSTTTTTNNASASTSATASASTTSVALETAVSSARAARLGHRAKQIGVARQATQPLSSDGRRAGAVKVRLPLHIIQGVERRCRHYKRRRRRRRRRRSQSACAHKELVVALFYDGAATRHLADSEQAVQDAVALAQEHAVVVRCA